MAGKTVLITGGNSGIGLVTATALAGMGARVVLACRRPQAADAAAQQILAVYPDASVETVMLDLASLESVRRGAEEVRGRFPVVDVLLNNAGLANVRVHAGDAVLRGVEGLGADLRARRRHGQARRRTGQTEHRGREDHQSHDDLDDRESLRLQHRAH